MSSVKTKLTPTVKLAKDLLPGDRVYWTRMPALILSNNAPPNSDLLSIHVLVFNQVIEWNVRTNARFYVISEVELK